MPCKTNSTIDIYLSKINKILTNCQYVSTVSIDPCHLKLIVQPLICLLQYLNALCI